MNTQQRISNLRSFGYTEREAAFLVQAALHSGYFLRRQYCSAIGRKLGKTIDSFVARLREKKHVKEIDLRYRRKVFSLCSKVLFEALGEPDNRNRRQHDAQTIKARLMGFDYILSHPEVRWLPTEADKVGLFTGELGIEKEHLPVWRYSSKDRKRTTLRWFVDRPLVCLDDQTKTVRFCFIDPGFRTGEAFASFLRNYRPLFTRLGGFEVTHVSGFDRPVEHARRTFDRLFAPVGCAPEDPLATELFVYFADRNEHATIGLAGFDQARLDSYREARRRFAGTRFEDLFALWQQHGDVATRMAISPETRPDLRSRGTFFSEVLKYNFGLFGSLYDAGQSE